MKSLHSFSLVPDTTAAVREIAGRLAAPDVRLVVYFASPRHNPQALAAAMAASFPGVPTLGCTTAGELVSGRMLEHSLVAMALGSELVTRAHLATVRHVAADTSAEVARAFATLSDAFGAPVADLDPARFAGLVLADGLSGAEERLMDAIGNRTNIPFVGGSAGDDVKFERTHVMAGPEALSNAAVVAIIETTAPFEIVKTQSFRILPTTLVATKVNEPRRQVLEFNGRPAVDAYAEAVGVAPAELASRFMSNPVGLIVDGEPFVRSPQRIEGHSVFFYCSILEGTELSVLQSTDIVADTGAALAKVKAPDAVIDFDCILRTLELRQKGQSEAYGALFAHLPTIGFSTYGEEYLGHLNQTATMLVLHS